MDDPGYLYLTLLGLRSLGFFRAELSKPSPGGDKKQEK